MMTTLSAEQLGMTLDYYAQEIFIEAGGIDKFYDVTGKWLAAKKQAFSGSAYVEQLEKNAVYFVEATGSTKTAILKFLYNGEPKLANASEIQNYVDYVGQEFPRSEIFANVLPFVRGFAGDKKPYQLSNYDWNDLRCLKQAGTQADYLKELERICRVYHPATRLADTFLSIFLRLPEFSASARDEELTELNDIINTKVQMWAEITAGELSVDIEGVPAHLYIAEMAQLMEDKRVIM